MRKIKKEVTASFLGKVRSIPGLDAGRSSL
jgi:hypothetical protein